MKKRSLASLFFTVFLLVIIPHHLILAEPFPAPSDIPGLSWQQVEQLLGASQQETIIAPIRLDGYILFSISSPKVENKQKENTEPIQYRRQKIERVLSTFANSPSADLPLVSISFDANSRLPNVLINNRYLMTVTPLDAQLQGTNPPQYANELKDIIQNALVRAREERELSFLGRQGIIAVMTLVLIFISNWFLKYFQSKYVDPMETKANLSPEVTDSQEGILFNSSNFFNNLISRQKQRIYDTLKILLWVFNGSLWIAGIIFILGLFPYSRWLQPLLLSTPLQLLEIGFLSYILIRGVNLLVDRLFSVMQSSHLVVNNQDQRTALRLATVSHVLKSIIAIVGCGMAILLGLSILGVNLVPLLAGAGIIGLAISFSAQSVIKDVINGFLILIEDQYGVGDVIMIGTLSGLVESMNLRVTKLRNSEGSLITVPNSLIGIVQNLSKDWSRVDLLVEFSHENDINHTILVLQKVADTIYQDEHWKEKLLDLPQVLGVEKITSQGVSLRIWLKTQPLKQWEVAREFRKRLMLELEQEGLSIYVPQQIILREK